MADSQHALGPFRFYSRACRGSGRVKEAGQKKKKQSINQYVLHHQARVSTRTHTHIHTRIRTQNGAAFAKRHFIVLDGVLFFFTPSITGFGSLSH